MMSERRRAGIASFTSATAARPASFTRKVAMLSLQRVLSWRYWRRHFIRALLVIVSIALGVATWVATGALQHSLTQACCRAARPLAGDADFYVGNGDAGVLAELAGPIADVPGVRRVCPLVIQRVVLPELGHRPALLLGI